VLAGLFFVMGCQALAGNGITLKLLFLAQDRELTSPSDPLKRIERRLRIWMFVAIQLLSFGTTFAITQTIAAIGFPVIILLLFPFGPGLCRSGSVLRNCLRWMRRRQGRS